MEVSQEAEKPEPEVQIGPTAKQMAAVEEENAKRMIDQIKADQLRAEQADYKAEPLINLATKGRQALEDAMRSQRAKEAAKPAYVPPPMTDRQKTALQEEMEAGRKRVELAEAQKVRAGHPTLPPPRDNNEGLNTPVYRDGEHVPGLAKTPTHRGSF